MNQGAGNTVLIGLLGAAITGGINLYTSGATAQREAEAATRQELADAAQVAFLTNDSWMLLSQSPDQGWIVLRDGQGHVTKNDSHPMIMNSGRTTAQGVRLTFVVDHGYESKESRVKLTQSTLPEGQTAQPWTLPKEIAGDSQRTVKSLTGYVRLDYESNGKTRTTIQGIQIETKYDATPPRLELRFNEPYLSFLSS